MSAVRWATALTFITQLLLWLVTIFVIRILSPADYGLMAMSMIFVSFAMIVNEFGLGSALVQRENPTSREIQSIHGFVLALNFILYCVFYLSAPILSQIFGEPILVPMLRVVALLFPILGFEVTALALLERNLEFRKKATIYMIANISGVVVTLALALLSAGVWSLVFGNLSSAIIKAAGINFATGKLIIPRWDLGLVRPYLRFGGFVAVERILWYLHRQADVFFIGKWLGKEELGYYYVALTLSSFVYDKAGGLMYEISLPTFAQARKERGMIAVVFVRALRIIAFVVFPLMFGLAAVSSDIVDLFIGQKWVAAAPLVLILCLSMPARIMGNLFPPALQGLGKPKSSLVNLAIAVIVMIPVLTYTASIDTYAVSLAWLVVYPIVLILMFNHSRALLELRWTESASAVLPPLLGSLAMFALVYWLGGQPLMTELAVEFRLVMTILSGMIIYLAFSLFVLRKQLAEFVALVRPQ
ncbi:MAG: lipopolysaccharide biosynthesis protein [Gammaproteobacteria bacterium]|nr:lipopolysaccharide biosynthesis protein [Gammaproteobacteria bacterium]NNL51724.1 lipopolysaccharide biosynthesis protein [Woeseiaceae bacterium]